MMEVLKTPGAPIVTVYTTVKNGLPFIREAVASIKAQSFDGSWEAVIVDDGSDDGTPEFLVSLEAEDSRFRCILTRGIGRGMALNLAIRNARGVYVANLDADDLAHPLRLQRQVSYLEESGNAFVSSSSAVFFDCNKATWQVGLPLRCAKLVDVTRELMKRNPVSHSTVMMRRDVLLECGGYDGARKAQLDYELWCRLAKRGVRLNKSKAILGAKRIHLKQSFENKKRLNYLLSSLEVQRDIIEYFGGGVKYHAYAMLRLAYGLLPQRLRMRRHARWDN